MIRIGIVATSSVIPKIELEMGVQYLESQGFEVEVHPIVWGEHTFYTGTDDDRAKALIDFAMNPKIDVIWFGRGGYGANQLLPYLNAAKKKFKSKKLKKKTMIGFSDVTSILEWFRVNLDWNTIHGPMPAMRTFAYLKESEWNGLKDLIHFAVEKEKIKKYAHKLTSIYLPKSFKKCEGKLVGGNLAVWNSLIGTAFKGNAKSGILFFEDLSENSGRINRMMHQLEQSGGLKGVKGIVLGDFTDCPDSVAMCLAERPPVGAKVEEFLRNPPKDKMRPLRQIYTTDESLEIIFKFWGERLNIPTFKGVPAGHGTQYHSLFIGKTHALDKNGLFSLK